MTMPAVHSSAKKQIRDTDSILSRLLESSFDFHDQASNYATHNFHAFPAKFPPQLPRVFIENLTGPGDVVLDPMMGSGTTVLEALLCHRRGIGCDIDPLAEKLVRVKCQNYSHKKLEKSYNDLLASLSHLNWDAKKVGDELCRRFSGKTKEFIDYWFLPRTQRELMSLLLAIEQVHDKALREFFEMVFSSIIITKSGGVSRARDLAHTRPHLDTTKVPKDAIAQFKTKAQKTIKSFAEIQPYSEKASIYLQDARKLPLADNSVDLIITSPPYSNAIDYMRAHKFSLVWLGEDIDELSQKRSTYIGSEKINNLDAGQLPVEVLNIVKNLAERDAKKAKIITQYYHDMNLVLQEMRRVLKSGRAAILVAGTSVMRGLSMETHVCLAELAGRLQFEIVGIKKRKLDRDRRMMPATRNFKDSLIEKRMHDEYIVALVKE